MRSFSWRRCLVANSEWRMVNSERFYPSFTFPNPRFPIHYSLLTIRYSLTQPRSDLMISVMVTPSLSSTSTTSPRATRRSLT